MADKVIFKISCPRCDSALSITKTAELNYCSDCGFPVQVTDTEDLLAQYKSGDIADVKFVERVLKGVKDKKGKSGRGLELVFRSDLLHDTVHDLNSEQLMTEELKRLEEESEKAKQFDNKTAHTQVIELSFDPAAYFEQGLNSKGSGREEKKISLKQVIEDQNKQSKYQRSNSSVQRLVISAILFTVLLCALIVGVVYYSVK